MHTWEDRGNLQHFVTYFPWLPCTSFAVSFLHLRAHLYYKDCENGCSYDSETQAILYSGKWRGRAHTRRRQFLSVAYFPFLIYFTSKELKFEVTFLNVNVVVDTLEWGGREWKRKRKFNNEKLMCLVTDFVFFFQTNNAAWTKGTKILERFISKNEKINKNMR